MNFFKTLSSGIASGIMVGIGGAVYMSCEDKVVGAVLFSVALLSICCLGMYLFTGKIGYLAESFNKETIASLFAGLIGNFIGATGLGLICACARPGIVEKAQSACSAKLECGILRAVILGALCGILMFIAVKIYRDCKSISGIVFCIPVFILSGFEHSIADMFYFSLAGMFSLSYAAFILSVIVGNTVGAMGFCFLLNISKPKSK